MRISDWSSYVCSSDLQVARWLQYHQKGGTTVIACTGPPTRLALSSSVRETARVTLQDVIRSRSEEHTSELQSLMRISYAVFCLKKKKPHKSIQTNTIHNNITKQHTQPTTNDNK